MPKPKWEGETWSMLDLMGLNDYQKELVIAFIRTQLEGVINSIPDCVFYGENGEEISSEDLQLDLRREWLGESKN